MHQAKLHTNYEENLMLEIDDSQIEQLQEFAQSGVEESVNAQRYPALQVNQYRGVQPKTRLSLCFAQESWDLIPDHLKVKLDACFEEVFYQDDKETGIYKIDYVRFIPLAIPRLFKENKVSGSISNLSAFVPGDRTIAKLFLAVVVKGEVLTHEDGTPLIVTLKLRSYKTQEVIGEDNEPGTLKNLSSELAKKKIGMPGRSNIHFVNLEIAPISKVYKNAAGESSRSVAYELRSAKINSKENMQAIAKLFEDQELLATMADPFKIKSTGELGNSEARDLILSEINQSIQALGLEEIGVQKLLIARFGVSTLTRLTVDELLDAKSLIDSQVRSVSGLDAIPF